MKKLNMKTVAKVAKASKPARKWLSDGETRELVVDAHANDVSVYQLIEFLKEQDPDGETRYEGLLFPYTKAYAIERELKGE